MSDEITKRFFHWVEASGLSRSTAAGMLGVDDRSLSTYRSRGLPAKKIPLAERLMAEHNESLRSIEDNKINITFTDDEFDLVQRAAAIVQTRFKDFIIRATIAKAREEIRRASPEPSQLRVAEDPGIYKSTPTGDKAAGK